MAFVLSAFGIGFLLDWLLPNKPPAAFMAIVGIPDAIADAAHSATSPSKPPLDQYVATRDRMIEKYGRP
jgi:hypothetical protein